MTERRDEAYVLRTHALGEADLIVSLFALRHGKVRGVARAARRSRRRFGGALEPLTRVRVGWSERRTSELAVIESLEAERSFAAMQADPAVQAGCAVICEVSEAFAREEQADPAVFRLIGATLRALEGGADVWQVVRYFEFWMLRIHGLFPDLDRCAGCGGAIAPSGSRFVVPAVGVLDSGCARVAGSRARQLGAAELGFLAAARGGPPERIAVTPHVVRAGGALEVLLRGTLEGFAEKRFRSYRHLGQATPETGREPGP